MCESNLIENFVIFDTPDTTLNVNSELSNPPCLLNFFSRELGRASTAEWGNVHRRFPVSQEILDLKATVCHGVVSLLNKI